MSIVVTGIIVVLAVLFIIGWLVDITVCSNGKVIYTNSSKSSSRRSSSGYSSSGGYDSSSDSGSSSSSSCSSD